VSRVRRFRAAPERSPDSDSRSSDDANPDTTDDPNPGIATPATRTVRELSRRLEEILESAEQAATEIEEEATTAARGYTERRRREADLELEQRLRAVDRETEGRTVAATRLEAVLRRKAQAVLTQAHELASAAETVLALLAEPPEESVGGEAGGRLEEAGTRETRSDTPSEEAALLRAAHLAVAGRSRSDIELTLRTEFGIDSPEAIVDEILGSGGGGS
jgi:hypothetical protein